MIVDSADITQLEQVGSQIWRVKVEADQGEGVIVLVWSGSEAEASSRAVYSELQSAISCRLQRP